MQLAPKLQPFWHTPGSQTDTSPVRFKLRPLTQAEITEVEGLYAPREPGGPPMTTPIAKHKAATLSIIACDGITDEKGEPIKSLVGIDGRAGAQAEDLRHMILECGLRIIFEMIGLDWKKVTSTGDEAAKPQQPAETDSEKT